MSLEGLHGTNPGKLVFHLCPLIYPACPSLAAMVSSRSSLPDLSLKFRMGSLSGAGGQLPPSAFDDLSMPEGRVTPAALLNLARYQSGSGMPPTSDKILDR